MYELIGESKAIKEIKEYIPKIAKTNKPILITGETGVGKEIVANNIHFESLRFNKPYIAINCAALPQELIENELFGHEKGAFTNAYETAKGKLEFCNEGTLLLDEICDMGGICQAKLLRVLQFGEFYRVGGNKVVKTDVRFISATNKSMEKYIEIEKFRQDLFYRINAFHIHIPPLRARKEDIKPIILSKLEKEKLIDNDAIKLNPEAYKLLMDYDYPGNVRELLNIIDRVLISIGEGKVIEPSDIQFGDIKINIPICDKIETLYGQIMPQIFDFVEYSVGIKEFYKTNLTLFDKSILKFVLLKYKNDISATSRVLGITRNTLYDKIKKLNIDINIKPHIVYKKMKRVKEAKL